MVDRVVQIYDKRITPQDFKIVQYAINNLLNIRELHSDLEFQEMINNYSEKFVSMRIIIDKFKSQYIELTYMESINLFLSTLICFMKELKKYTNFKTVRDVYNDLQKLYNKLVDNNNDKDKKIKILSIKEL